MWKTRIISDGGLSRTDGGFKVDIRLPWYRSLPLSTMRGFALEIDGHAIPDDQMVLEVNGKDFHLNELEPLVDEWWHVLDSAYLKVTGVELEAGSSHEVDVAVTFEIPYVEGAVIASNCVKTLAVA